MKIPLWGLLSFAGRTLAVLSATIGVYLWFSILTGRTTIGEWHADPPQAAEWYRRATRAHMNCIENLPVYGAIVVCATAVGAKGNFLDSLALALIAARVCQTIVHIVFAQ